MRRRFDLRQIEATLWLILNGRTFPPLRNAYNYLQI